jgi:peptide subunit release factor 1 (eRF1)
LYLVSALADIVNRSQLPDVTQSSRRNEERDMARLQKFSEVGENGCCPKCGYAVMKRGVNALTSNLAVGAVATLATGGLLGPTRKKIRCGGCGTKYLLG